MPRLIFFSIHSTTPWWKYLGSRIDFADVTVLSDLRGEGDRTLVDDFYHFMEKATRPRRHRSLWRGGMRRHHSALPVRAASTVGLRCG